MWMTSLSQFPLLIHPTRKVQNSRLADRVVSLEIPSPLYTRRAMNLVGTALERDHAASRVAGNSDSLLRRTFLAASAGCLAGFAAEGGEDLRVLDIHQHTNYSGRSDDQLVAHQRKMGVTKTILLPSGNKPTPGLELGGTETCINLSRNHPKEFVYFGNELPDIPETRETLEKYLKMGALGI